ncbi:MAG: S41 family peptidase [Meiothermus sp.]|nr:S41 family peptidase [Meiothermus sp.]
MLVRWVVLAFVLLVGLAWTSPASDLLQQAVGELRTHYYGYSVVDWDVLAEQSERELAQACAGRPQCGVEEAARIIARLVRNIGDGHTFYLSPERYQQILARFAGKPDPRPVYGITIPAYADGRALISEVRPQSAADLAGVRPYDRVEAVNGTPLTSLEDFRARINTDQPVRLTLLRGEERLQLTLSRQPYSLPVLPTLYAPRGLPEGVLVLRIPDFAVYQQIGPRVHQLVLEAQARGARALIVDLRDNSGGEETECSSAPGAFVGNFALEMRTKMARVPFGYADGAVLGNDPKDPNPPYRLNQAARFTGQVAVLVSPGTASCGEIMAYVLQQFGGIKVIGQRTAGVMNTATEFWPLADGSAIAITYIRTFKANGEALPAFVTPDIEMAYEPEAIARTGRDAMLEKALEVMGIR